MHRYLVFGLVVGLALLISGGIGAGRKQERNKQVADDQEAEYKAELADATPVQIGVLSEQQRLHSNLFSYYLQMRSNRKISDLVAQASGKSKIVTTEVLIGLGELLAADTPEHYFHALLRKSDTVIRGRVTRKASQITEDEGFVFTDYEVFVTEVIRNKASAPLEYGATITVTRPGGKVLLNQVIVRAIDDLFAPLPLNGHDVVLFLKYMPETATYRATEEGSFELDGSSLRPLTGASFPAGVLQDANSFLQTVRSVSNR